MGEYHVAYDAGPINLVYVSNWVWAVDLIWDFPATGWLEALGQTGRTIQFDMPGTGSSDPLPSSGLGLAVHAAARIMSSADPGGILASSTVNDLVIGSDTRFDDRGSHALKGVPGEWRAPAVKPS